MKKKILVFTNHFYPEQFRINDICTELVDRGYDVSVITQIPNYSLGKFYEGYSSKENRYETWNGVKIRRLWCIPRGNSSITLALNYLSFWFSSFWFSVTNKLDVDSVLAYMTSPIFMVRAAQRLAKKAKATMVLYTLDMWPNNFYAVMGITKSWITKPLDLYCKRTYLKNDTNIVSSKNFMDEIRKLTGENLEFKYLPQHGESIYTQLPKPDEFNYLENGLLNITFTGNVGKAQGLDFLVDAAKLLKQRNTNDIRFNIVGDGSYLETFKSLVKNEMVQQYFVFHGRKGIEEISPILAETDLGLISFANDPVYFMTIPAKLQSYLACGVPVITHADGAVNDLVLEENLGFATKIGDVEGFVQALDLFRSMDHENKEARSTLAKEFFEENYDKNRIIDKLETYL